MVGNGDGGGGWRSEPESITSIPVLHVRIARERAAVGELNATLEQNLHAQVPAAALRAVQVALDELLTNVIMHAQQAAGPIEVEVAREQHALATTIIYVAAEFDPTAWRPALADPSIATARIGGLGIQLVRSLMDEFGYAYDDGRNIVSLRKRC